MAAPETLGRGPRTAQMLRSVDIRAIVFFLLVASASSVFRFGHRENEEQPLSDSDYYLDMAMVFAGEKPAFDEVFVGNAPHHYNRPALPFMAAVVARLFLRDNFRAAFSILNIFAALVIALLLYRMVLFWEPSLRYPWLPSLLFLTAFPQMNWGYHILTDTSGYATAFASLLLGMGVVDRMRSPHQPLRRLIPLLLLLFLVQSLAFLTRETGWFVVLGLAAYIAVFRVAREVRITLIACVLGIVLAAKLPHLAYSVINDLHAPQLRLDKGLLDPWYVADFLVKSAVAFHLCWIPVAAYILSRHRPSLPPFVIVWTVAAVLYIAAGYIHNRHGDIGYPLRFTFSLFPLIYILTGWFIEQLRFFRHSIVRVGAVSILIILINIVGVLLDQEQGRIRVYDLLQGLIGQ